MPTTYQTTSLSWQQFATTWWLAFFGLACVAIAGLIWTVGQGRPDLADLASEMVVHLDEHQPLREQQ